MGLQEWLVGGEFPSSDRTTHTHINRWLYIIEGIFSIVCAFAVWFGLPNDPAQAWFLNAEEREMMRCRAIQREQYMGSDKFDWSEVRIAFKDPKLYMR
jgi:hypothetical protein